VAGADEVITTAAEHDQYAADEAPDPWASAETPAPRDTTAELDDWEVDYR
jgi:hypothetical protein